FSSVLQKNVYATFFLIFPFISARDEILLIQLLLVLIPSCNLAKQSLCACGSACCFYLRKTWRGDRKEARGIQGQNLSKKPEDGTIISRVLLQIRISCLDPRRFTEFFSLKCF
ncbi:hypothetical protein ACJX0J_017274, partial [Zea mays]